MKYILLSRTLNKGYRVGPLFKKILDKYSDRESTNYLSSTLFHSQLLIDRLQLHVMHDSKVDIRAASNNERKSLTKELYEDYQIVRSTNTKNAEKNTKDTLIPMKKTEQE